MTMASGLSINQVALTIVAISIGIVLIGSLLAPVAYVQRLFKQQLRMSWLS